MSPSRTGGLDQPEQTIPAVLGDSQPSPKPTVPGATRAASPVSGMGEKKRNAPEEDWEDPDLETRSRPPPVLSKSAIYNRLRRVFVKRANGTMQLDDHWNNLWSDIHGGGREQVMAMFEKIGYDADRVD